MQKNVKILLFLLGATLLAWVAGAFFVGIVGIPLFLGFFAATAGMLWAARGLPVRGWMAIGLVILAGLFLPIGRLNQNIPAQPEVLNNLVNSLLFWTLILALLVAAILIYAAASQPQLQPRRVPPAYPLVLSALLLLKTLGNIYWLTVWDNTYDPLSFFWLILPTLAAIVSAIGLVAFLRGRRKLAGSVFLLLPFLMVAVSFFAQQVDNHAVTQARAARVARAVESYQVREGRYPASLGALFPRDALLLAGPLLVYGQTWCYAATPDGYRLGYLDRTPWYAPTLTVHLAGSGGDPSSLPPACAAESAALLKNLPGDWEVSEVSP